MGGPRPRLSGGCVGSLYISSENMTTQYKGRVGPAYVMSCPIFGILVVRGVSRIVMFYFLSTVSHVIVNLL